MTAINADLAGPLSLLNRDFQSPLPPVYRGVDRDRGDQGARACEGLGECGRSRSPMCSRSGARSSSLSTSSSKALTRACCASRRRPSRSRSQVQDEFWQATGGRAAREEY